MEQPKAPAFVAATQPTLPTQIPTTRKRPFESDSTSNYFKLRAIVRDLRPHFIQVVKTPNYKNCNASHEIREQLKIMMKLFNEMKEDVISLRNQQPKRVKSFEQARVEQSYARPSVGGESQALGTYVIGGSAFGWNFITFPAAGSVYYGRTKEQFRSGKMTK